MRNGRYLGLVVSAVVAAGCSSTPTVNVSGVVFNINQFATQRAMGVDGPTAFGASLVAGQQISTTLSVDDVGASSAADGTFTTKAPANSTFMMVARENAEFVRTITIAPVTTTNVDLQLMVPVIACPEVAETTILATGAGLTAAALVDRGFSVFATHALPAPPSDVPVTTATVAVAESADYDIYQFQGNHLTGMVEAAPGNMSPIGLYGLVPKAKVGSQRDAHVTVTDMTGMHTFDPLTIPIEAGFFSSALALSTH